MNTDRIKEIQQETAYPESVSVQQALLKVWNETEQEQLRKYDVIGQSEQLANFCKKISKQEDCPAKFQEIVNKEFWNLIG